MLKRLEEIRRSFTLEVIYCKDPYTRSSNILKYISDLIECGVRYTNEGAELTYDGHMLTDAEYYHYISDISNCTITAMRKCLASA